MTDLELNTAIAALLGAPKTHEWEYTGECTYDASVYECERCGDSILTDCREVEGNYPCLPPYATDLNRAVAAGQALGMFEYDVNIHIQKGCGRQFGAGVTHAYEYRDSEVSHDKFEHLAVDFQSPARAVCKATGC